MTSDTSYANSHASAGGDFQKAHGHVTLVGAGPGNPAYAARAALDELQQADSVYYDRLAQPVLEAAQPLKARLINVGKEPGDAPVHQREIENLIIRDALSGQRVVRLKGGDPFIFGRGGEEAEALRIEGIHVHTVPGVSAMQAAATALGIPLTHRETGASIEVFSAHDLPPTPASARALSPFVARAEALRHGTTLAVYMGMTRIERLVDLLLGAGCPAWMPTAVVSQASLPGQQIVRCRLNSLVRHVSESSFTAPAIIFVGLVLLRSWLFRLTPASTRYLALGSEEGLYHESADLDAAHRLSASLLMVARTRPNIHALAHVESPAQMRRVVLASSDAAAALHASLLQKGWMISDLVTSGVEVATPMAQLIPVARAMLRAPVNLCHDWAGHPDLLLVESSNQPQAICPVAGIDPLPRQLEAARQYLNAPSLQGVVLCDRAAALISLELIRNASLLRLNSGLPPLSIHTRDLATRRLLQAHGLAAESANRLHSVESRACLRNRPTAQPA